METEKVERKEAEERKGRRGVGMNSKYVASAVSG